VHWASYSGFTSYLSYTLTLARVFYSRYLR